MNRLTKILIFLSLLCAVSCAPTYQYGTGDRRVDKINNRASVRRNVVQWDRNSEGVQTRKLTKAEKRAIPKEERQTQKNIERRQKEITKEFEKERKRREKMQNKETQKRLKEHRKESRKNFKRS